MLADRIALAWSGAGRRRDGLILSGRASRGFWTPIPRAGRPRRHRFKSHYQAAADKAAEQQRSHADYLAQLAEGETALRESRDTSRAPLIASTEVARPL
jgi:hypothetical protein